MWEGTTDTKPPVEDSHLASGGFALLPAKCEVTSSGFTLVLAMCEAISGGFALVPATLINNYNLF